MVLIILLGAYFKNDIFFSFWNSFPLFIETFGNYFLPLLFANMECPDYLYPLFNHPVQRRLPTYILAGFAVVMFWIMTHQTYYRKTPDIYGDLYKTLPNGKMDECDDIMNSFVKRVWFNTISNFFICLQGLYASFICSIISFACIGEFDNHPGTIGQRYTSIILIVLCSWECIAVRAWYAVCSLIVKIILCCAITVLALADLVTTIYILVHRYGFLN